MKSSTGTDRSDQTTTWTRTALAEALLIENRVSLPVVLPRSTFALPVPTGLVSQVGIEELGREDLHVRMALGHRREEAGTSGTENAVVLADRVGQLLDRVAQPRMARLGTDDPDRQLSPTGIENVTGQLQPAK